MTKEQFNNLDTTEQIQYINNNIGAESLTKYCDSLGINRSTISKRFKVIGYTFDKSTNQYILNNDTVDIKECNDNITATKETTTTTDPTNISMTQYKALEERIRALEDIIYNNNTAVDIKEVDTVDIKECTNSIRFYKNELVVRAYRIDEEIYRRFKAYTDANKQYKISDIISTALEEFLEKYDK